MQPAQEAPRRPSVETLERIIETRTPETRVAAPDHDRITARRIDIVDVDNGHRLTTYVIAGPAGEGRIGINGAAAHLVGVGDTVILIAYGMFGPDEVATHEPRVVFVDGDNRIVERGTDPAHAPEGSGLVDPRDG